ncbi:MAG: replicative DNA helicase [Alphaproteobacteria bacterium]|jgi:replicative DNA helicase
MNFTDILAKTAQYVKDGSDKNVLSTSKESNIAVNIDAEQGIIGSILNDNEMFEETSSIISANNFFDSAHQLIYEKIEITIANQRIATPLTLKNMIEHHPSFEDAEDAYKYLVFLMNRGVGPVLTKEYSRILFDLSTLRSLRTLGYDIIGNSEKLSEGSPAEFITQAEQSLYEISQTGRTEKGFISFALAISQAIQGATAANQRGGKLAGVATKLTDLDQKLGGLHPSDLIILAGRPSMGKTALATNIAFNVAAGHRQEVNDEGQKVTVNGGVVAFFSLEMSADQLAARILAEQAEVSSEKLRRGDFSEDEFFSLNNAAKHLEEIPLFIDDTPALALSTLAARCRRLKRQHGLDLIVVDYLQLLRPPSHGRRNDNRVQELTEISMGLKAIAKELSVPVVALSQLSRQVEQRDDKRPQLSDLRESGSIEQDADVVMFVYREEYYIGRGEPTMGTPEHEKWQTDMSQCRNIAEVIIGKQRHGPIGNVRLQFNAQFTRFSDLINKDYEDHITE